MTLSCLINTSQKIVDCMDSIIILVFRPVMCTHFIVSHNLVRTLWISSHTGHCFALGDFWTIHSQIKSIWCHHTSPAVQFKIGQRRWLIYPNCSNVFFLSHCTNDYLSVGGTRGFEERGAREQWRRLGTHHLPCGMPGCVRTAAKPHLSWK